MEPVAAGASATTRWNTFVVLPRDLLPAASRIRYVTDRSIVLLTKPSR
jgi:hypothetical protein